MGPRSRGLRDNVEIEQTDTEQPDTSRILETPIHVDPRLGEQAYAREYAAKADNLHRQVALVNRSGDIRRQLAAAWSDLD